MNRFDDTFAAVHNYMRTHEQPIFEGALMGELCSDGFDDRTISIVLSAMTSGGTVVENNGWLSTGQVDRSLP